MWLGTRKAKPPVPGKAADQSFTGKLIDLARERPVVTAGAVTAAAAAAIVVALKNPRILSAIIAGAFASRPPPRR